MNFHLGPAKFHLLCEFLGSPKSIPVSLTGICRICELLHSAADKLLNVMNTRRWKASVFIRASGLFLFLTSPFPSPPLPFSFPSLFLPGLPPSFPYFSVHFITENITMLSKTIIMLFFHKFCKK